jgi:hypothetical protein
MTEQEQDEREQANQERYTHNFAITHNRHYGHTSPYSKQYQDRMQRGLEPITTENDQS